MYDFINLKFFVFLQEGNQIMKLGIKELLQDYALRHTMCREKILDAFLEHEFALAYNNLESQLKHDFDRVTIYRTLKTFLEKGIIHKILDDEGTPKYALCKEKCSSKQHKHEHVHFKCIKCGLTHCIQDLEIPAITLPKGYLPLELNLLVQGICKECNTSKNKITID